MQLIPILAFCFLLYMHFGESWPPIDGIKQYVPIVNPGYSYENGRLFEFTFFAKSRTHRIKLQQQSTSIFSDDHDDSTETKFNATIFSYNSHYTIKKGVAEGTIENGFFLGQISIESADEIKEIWIFERTPFQLQKFFPHTKAIFYDSTDLLDIAAPKPKNWPPMPNAFKYYEISYNMIDFLGKYEFLFTTKNGSMARVRLIEKLSLDKSLETGFGTMKDWTGTITILMPHKIMHITGRGFFDGNSYIGRIYFKDDAWFFNCPFNAHSSSTFYTYADQKMCLEPSIIRPLQIQQWPAQMEDYQNDEEGKFCIIKPIVGNLFLTQLEKDFGENSMAYLSIRLGMIQKSLNSFFGNQKFGRFGMGPRFAFSSPLILPDFRPESVNDARKKISKMKIGKPCLKAFLTFLPFDNHGQAYINGTCREMGLSETDEIVYPNLFIINWAKMYNLKDEGQLKSLFKHEIAHTLGAEDEPEGSEFLMKPSMSDDESPSENIELSEQSKKEITEFLESLHDIASTTSDKSPSGHKMCLVSKKVACAKTGSCD